MSEPHCMRCSKRLVEDRGICADCEVLFLDDAVRLKQALEVALRDERQALAQLTIVQARCSELVEKVRAKQDAEIIFAALVVKAGGELSLTDFDLTNAFGLELSMVSDPLMGGRTYRAYRVKNGESQPVAQRAKPTAGAKYQITYFKKSGKYYTTDEDVIWPTDAPDHSGFNPLSSFHRIKTMHAVCMDAPHGFPQFSPAQRDEDEGHGA